MSRSTSSHLTVTSDLQMDQSDANRESAEKSTMERHSQSDAKGIAEADQSRDKARGKRKLRSRRSNVNSPCREGKVKASLPNDRPAKPSFGIAFTSDGHTASHPVIISVSLIDACWIDFEVLRIIDDCESVPEVWIRVERFSNAEGHFAACSVKSKSEEWVNVQQNDVDELLSLAERFEGSGQAGLTVYMLPEDLIPEFVATRIVQPTLH